MKGTGGGAFPRSRPRADGELHSRHREVSPALTFRYHRCRPDSAGSAKAPDSFTRSPRAPDRAIQIPRDRVSLGVRSPRPAFQLCNLRTLASRISTFLSH